MKVLGTAVSVQGASHIVKNKICQDASRYVKSNDFSMIVVCDGHGGEKYVRSDVGSKLAVEATVDVINDLMCKSSHLKTMLNRGYKFVLNKVSARIILEWNRRIKEHYLSNELQGVNINENNIDKYMSMIKHLYGTTIVVAVITEEFWFGIRNGDGDCISIYDDGKIMEEIPWNDKNQFNFTTSLCNSKAIEDFNYFYSEKLPRAIVISTDGVIESFESNDYYFKFIKDNILTLVQKSTEKEIKSVLKTYLPILSEKGSGDDMSIALMYLPVENKDDYDELIDLNDDFI
jgi:serine/threonine protein phosphatase PrpC